MITGGHGDHHSRKGHFDDHSQSSCCCHPADRVRLVRADGACCSDQRPTHHRDILGPVLQHEPGRVNRSKPSSETDRPASGGQFLFVTPCLKGSRRISSAIALKAPAGAADRLLQPDRQQPGHHPILSNVSNIAQTPGAQRRNSVLIGTSSQGVPPSFQLAEPEPIRVSVALAPKHVGRKEIPWDYLQSYKETR
jgi:hypothetical protein